MFCLGILTSGCASPKARSQRKRSVCAPHRAQAPGIELTVALIRTLQVHEPHGVSDACGDPDAGLSDINDGKDAQGPPRAHLPHNRMHPRNESTSMAHKLSHVDT